jgi:hypothetical protein
MNESSALKESKNSKKKSKLSQKGADKSVKKKKKRKTKDPDAPKRPLGAYFYYFKANNTKVHEECPELIQKQVVAKIASEWKTLTDEQKIPFVEKSKQDKLRYIQEKEVFDEKKRKEEEDAQEENKYPSTSHYDRNGQRRSRPDTPYNAEDEKEIRLVDIIGIDQISYPSDPDELAPYSPPPISLDGCIIKPPAAFEQAARRVIQRGEINNNQYPNNEHREKEQQDGKYL